MKSKTFAFTTKLVLLLVAVVLLSACTITFQSPISLAEPTTVPTTIPTKAPAIAVQTEPAADPYFQEMAVRFAEYNKQYQGLNELIQMTSVDPALFYDPSWVAQLEAQCGQLNSAADDLLELEPSPYFVPMHSIITDIAFVTKSLTNNIVRGVVYSDIDSINASIGNMEQLNELLGDLGIEMKASVG